MKYNKIHLASLWLCFLTIISLAGCSEGTHPGMLEPIIRLSEATDISRTEASLTATIDMQGSSKMTYLILFYLEIGTEAPQKINGNPTLDEVEFHLANLKPGCQYTCHLEGGTETATISSNTIYFTTIPNELPKLSDISLLSTGPTCIIVEYSIIEDGGEPLLKAGCEIRSNGSNEGRQIYLQDENLKEGTWQISISGLTPQSTYIITPFAANSVGEAHGASLEYTTKNSIVLQQPGQLATLLAGSPDIDINPLTISGPMDGDDFRTLRSILGAPYISEVNPFGLKTGEIDLTDVVISEGGGSYDGSHFTVANEVSTDMFADCKLLRSILLPNSATRLARNAFARCSALESIIISAGIEQIIPSSDCDALERIEVSKANSIYSSIDGVLFNHAGTEIIWFPCGKTGEYQLPPTLTAIGENAFSGTSITTLIIPSSVTTISRGAFYGSSLQEISLPDNLTNISEGMFQDCSSLTTVRLGKETEYIGNFAFDGTDMADLYVPATIPPVAAPDAFVNAKRPMAENCILHVPAGTKKIYRNHQRWGTFDQIEEY